MIKCAEQSPRVCDDGTIRWYEGDTFDLKFELTFIDDDGNVITPSPTDKLSICFRNSYGQIVYETEMVGASNSLKVNMNEELTKKFKVGSYIYCVRKKTDYITTIMRKNRVVVE